MILNRNIVCFLTVCVLCFVTCDFSALTPPNERNSSGVPTEVNTDDYSGGHSTASYDCECAGGTCEWNNFTGRVECTCPPGFAVYKKSGIFGSRTYCKACECGEKAVKCTYHPTFWSNNKKCSCEHGYFDRGGKCTECTCPGPEYACVYQKFFWGIYFKKCIKVHGALAGTFTESV